MVMPRTYTEQGRFLTVIIAFLWKIDLFNIEEGKRLPL